MKMYKTNITECSIWTVYQCWSSGDTIDELAKTFNTTSEIIFADLKAYYESLPDKRHEKFEDANTQKEADFNELVEWSRTREK